MNIEQKQKEYLALCEEAVQTAANEQFMDNSVVSEAAAYSLLNGGKRVRGLLVLAVCEMLGGSPAKAQSFAAALEMVHAFSLVHDDLPCMDDDEMRRGKPSCHVQYGEDMALLAGDALLAAAFGQITCADLPPKANVEAIRELAKAAGAQGMIYGQELDMQFEYKKPNETELAKIHRYKTGALIAVGAKLGALAAGASDEASEPTIQFAQKLGMVFQIVDDILDVTSDDSTLGKPVGSDAQNGKTTYASLFGLEAARNKAKELTEQAAQHLESFGTSAEFLVWYARQLAARVS